MIKSSSKLMPTVRKTLNLVAKLLYFSIEIYPKLEKVIWRFGDRYDELWDRKNNPFDLENQTLAYETGICTWQRVLGIDVSNAVLKF